MSKPTLNPAWSINNDPLDNIEPEESFKLGGVQSGNPWARENLNWQFYALSQWIEWVKNDASDRTLNLSDLTDKPQALIHLGLQNPATLIKAATEGNAGSATKLLNKRKINGVDFDGTSDITITANPNSHTHGNITNDGKIGTTANLPIITGTGGALRAGAFGNAANTFTQGNDSRLSDAREWTASTIPQAEVEAGLATTRRAFTAQRFRQGIVAWFNGISGALGRTILGRATASQVRGDLELGTAATKDVGIEAGNVMEVGTGTRRIATTPSIAVTQYARIGQVQDDTSIAFLLSGGGDHGHATRQNTIIAAGSRRGSVSVSHTELTSTTPATSVEMYYVPLGGSDFDIWISKPSFQRTISLHILDSWGEIVDTPVWENTLPTNAVLVTRNSYYHTGNILTSTGTSADFPMSQKAVTDAIVASNYSLQQNIKVTVGTGGDFPTINAAILHLSRFTPDLGVTAEVELMSGFVMSEQLFVEGLNLGWITITGVDAETVINEPSLTRVLVDANKPAFGVTNGTLPTIGQLFIFSSKGSVYDRRSGVVAHNLGRANILSGCGVKNAGYNGISTYNGSTINADRANVSGAGQHCISASSNSTINAINVNASGAGTHGSYVYRGSTINANGASGTLSQTKNTVTSDGIIFQ